MPAIALYVDGVHPNDFRYSLIHITFDYAAISLLLYSAFNHIIYHAAHHSWLFPTLAAHPRAMPLCCPFALHISGT